MSIKSYLIALIVFLSSSCSNHLRYFTQDMYMEFQWSDRDLERIQFYVSQDIILHRKLSAEETRISKGKIRVIDGSKVEEVIIEEGTPGIFIKSPKEDRFAISFEEDESNFLMFGPNPKASGRYVLLAKEWSKRTGKVSYGGKIYETSSASAYAALMVDIKKARKIHVKSRRAGGKRIN